MNYAAEILDALNDVPSHIATPVLTDINQRIMDWLAGGGDPEASYIQQQVNYARNIGKRFGQQKSH